MIPIKKPTDEVILEVLEGFLSRNYTRDDIYAWQGEMRRKFAEYYPGCMSILAERKEGDFIVQSLVFIKDKGIVNYESADDFFLRDEDIQEYIATLRSIDCTEKNGKIERVRFHQIMPRKGSDYPLVCLNPVGGEIIKKFGVFFSRVVVDDLAEHVGYASVKYENANFYLQHRYDSKEYQFTIFGFKGSDKQLANMLFDLGISFNELSFVNEYTLLKKTELWRLDDNANEFLISEFDFEIEAELSRRKLEDKGHKQTYFLRSKSA